MVSTSLKGPSKIQLGRKPERERERWHNEDYDDGYRTYCRGCGRARVWRQRVGDGHSGKPGPVLRGGLEEYVVVSSSPHTPKTHTYHSLVPRLCARAYHTHLPKLGGTSSSSCALSVCVSDNHTYTFFWNSVSDVHVCVCMTLRNFSTCFAPKNSLRPHCNTIFPDGHVVTLTEIRYKGTLLFT